MSTIETEQKWTKLLYFSQITLGLLPFKGRRRRVFNLVRSQIYINNKIHPKMNG